MDTKKLVKASNVIGMVSVVLLVYWVFAFILIQVFGLRVFRQYLTETFAVSIMGILALMAGALILNIMLNLTRIAERGKETAKQSSSKTVYLLLAVFPLLAALLFGGDYLTAQQKRKILIRSAERLIAESPQQVDRLADYRFNLPYLQTGSEILNLMEREDTSFTSVDVIAADTVAGKTVYIGLPGDKNLDYRSEQIVPAQDGDGFTVKAPEGEVRMRKTDFVYRADMGEREYFRRVFGGQTDEIRFTSNDGSYELFYPYRKNGRTLIFRFSDYRSYGKLGS